jgi:hypothetical protein
MREPLDRPGTPVSRRMGSGPFVGEVEVLVPGLRLVVGRLPAAEDPVLLDLGDEPAVHVRILAVQRPVPTVEGHCVLPAHTSVVVVERGVGVVRVAASDDEAHCGVRVLVPNGRPLVSSAPPFAQAAQPAHNRSGGDSQPGRCVVIVHPGGPGQHEQEKTMGIKTTFRRTGLAVAGTLVATTLITGCGSSAADERAVTVSKNADSLAKEAGTLDETWQERAKREYWERQQFYDSWDKITPRTATPICH